MHRVAVVGSGISGLGAAYALRQAHCDVIVFESADRVGGRMQTQSADGYTWDPAAQFLLSKFETMLALLTELNVPVLRDSVPPTMGIVLSSMSPETKYYFRVDNPLSMFSHPQLSLANKVRLLKLFGQTFWYWRSLDFPWMNKVQKLDTKDTLRTVGDRDYGADALDYFLNLPTSNLFYWTPEETPWWMAPFSLKLMFNAKMFLPAGGMGAVTAALGRSLDVRLNHTVRRIDATDDGKAVLRVQGARGMSGVLVDRVIIATPAPVALTMLADPEQALGKIRANYLRTANYTQVLTMAVAYASAIERRAYGVFVPRKDSGGLLTIGWEHLKAQGRAPINRGLGVFSTTASFARQVWNYSDAEIARQMIDLAVPIYPNSSPQAHPLQVHRFPHATPIMEPTRSRTLDQARKAGPAAGSPIFTCGDYWLGPNVEQALITGYRAAGEVLQSLQSPVPTKLQI